MTPRPPPPWMPAGADAPLAFWWDDARVDDDFDSDPSAVLRAALHMTLRARLALAVALAEWTVWRFDGWHAHDEPDQVIEAAWCATVDPRYLAFCAFEREAWVGPVDGPLWCAMAWLHHGISQGARHEGDLFDAIEWLHGLAWHVAAERPAFDHWCEVVLARLVAAHPLDPPADPFDDLFDHRLGERLGPLVNPDLFDPRLSPAAEATRAALARRFADAAENPFLATPDDLADLGFQGEAFRVPE